MAPSSPLLEARKLTVGVAGKVFCRDLDFALAAGERLAISVWRSSRGRSGCPGRVPISAGLGVNFSAIEYVASCACRASAAADF